MDHIHRPVTIQARSHVWIQRKTPRKTYSGAFYIQSFCIFISAINCNSIMRLETANIYTHKQRRPANRMASHENEVPHTNKATWEGGINQHKQTSNLSKLIFNKTYRAILYLWGILFNLFLWRILHQAPSFNINQPRIKEIYSHACNIGIYGLFVVISISPSHLCVNPYYRNVSKWRTICAVHETRANKKKGKRVNEHWCRVLDDMCALHALNIICEMTPRTMSIHNAIDWMS